VKDPDEGGEEPRDGALPTSRLPGRGRARPRRQEGRSAASGHVGGTARNGASQENRPQKKRRRRKRGRKVFARDGHAMNGHVARERAADGTHTEARKAGDAALDGPARPLPAAPPGSAPKPAWIAREGRTRGLPPRSGPSPVYAALDLGTNNCRLLVAIPTRPGQFRVIDAFSRIVRLGEGLTANGRLSEQAMDRAVEALGVCAEKLRSREVRSARLIATEACRSAENGAAFLARVAGETGLTLEIIDRETEARLAVSGCGSLVERDTHGVVLFDIGGGSSEIALIDVSGRRSPRLANHIVSWTSLPVGVVSLAERFGGRHVSREVFEAMVAEVGALLEMFEGRNRLAHLARGERFHLLGTSGTVTTLAGLHLGLARYDRRRVDGLWMDDLDVERMIDRLLGWKFEERVANACIGADRADLVLAGCAILEAIRRVWPSDRLRVADRGLREGILSELMSEDGAWRRHGQRQW
jgi:exopolyphosphatase/guanosine-5'-triphosphate,3'-diphosphate pyrophosphatase